MVGASWFHGHAGKAARVSHLNPMDAHQVGYAPRYCPLANSLNSPAVFKACLRRRPPLQRQSTTHRVTWRTRRPTENQKNLLYIKEKKNAFSATLQVAAPHKEPYSRPLGGKPRPHCDQERGGFCSRCRASVPVGLLALKAILGKLLFRKAIEARKSFKCFTGGSS